MQMKVKRALIIEANALICITERPELELSFI